jgi:iron complex outermembrane receptor protein
MGQRHYMVLAILSAVAAGAATTQQGAAAAATASDTAPSGLEEVVVTSRRIQESAQSAPLSVTALSAADLAARGVQSIVDVAPSTPNVTIEQNTGDFGKSVLAFIRGVGQSDFLPAFEPGVGFYIDDVYQGTLFGALLDLTDIDRVEVLRGPQGTLFGKSNEGGAVRIVSPKAKGDDSGYVEVGYGSYQRQLFKGSYDVSLVPDKLFLRIGGGSNSYNGYMSTYDFACARPSLAGSLPRTSVPTLGGDCRTGTLGADSVQVARGDLRWLVQDGLEVSLVADITDDHGEPAAEKLIAVDPTNPTLAGYNTGFGIPFDTRFITSNPYSSYSTYNNPTTGQTLPRVSDVLSWGTSGTLDWDIGDGVHLKNILAYRQYRGEFTEIWGNAPIHINDNYFKPYHRQYSEELQLSGTLLQNRLDWTAGAYFYGAYTELNDFIDIAAANFAFYGVDPVEDRDRSGFLHGVYHVTDKLDLELGTRYTDESKTYTFNRYLPQPAPFLTLPGFENNPSATAHTSRVDYRASIKYQWTPALMTYLQFATGFKGGGINPRPSAIDEVRPFAAETVKSYELGIKSQWLDNRLRVNLDGYFSDYRNLQLTIPENLNGVPGNVVSNAGRVYISGLEGEFQAEPLPRLMLNASFGYMHYDIRDLGAAAGVAGGPAYGDTAPYVPDWKVNFGAQYGWELNGAGRLTPRLDWTWQSKTFNDVSNAPIAAQGGYGLLNAHLTYDSPERKWQAALEVKNATNRQYYVNEYYLYAAFGVLEGLPGMPRTYLVSLRRSF